MHIKTSTEHIHVMSLDPLLCRPILGNSNYIQTLHTMSSQCVMCKQVKRLNDRIGIRHVKVLPQADLLASTMCF